MKVVVCDTCQAPEFEPVHAPDMLWVCALGAVLEVAASKICDECQAPDIEPVHAPDMH